MKHIFITFLLFLIPVVSYAQGFDRLMREAGLRSLLDYDSTLLVDMKYATIDNFVGRDMYSGLVVPYAQVEICEMVRRAHDIIKAEYPHYRLLILDAARPMSVQKIMHDIVAGTPLHIYVSNPSKGGGRHNYGVAVDLTIVEMLEEGNYRWVDMGAGFDDFRAESHGDAFTKGLITERQRANREVLEGAMRAVGFGMIKSEWWHFQKYGMDELPHIYKRLDF